MANEYEVTYGRFLNMLSEKFGYTNEVNRGFSGLADLLDSGAVLDKNGEPILAHPEKGEENRAKTIQEKLAGGDPLYIYYPGEQFPREVTYNPATGFQVSDQPVSKPQKPEKEPNLFSKAFFQFFRVTGFMTKTYREWHEYHLKKDLFEKVSDRKMIDNRRRNDRILRKSGDAFVSNDKVELTESLIGVVADQLGYGAELESKGPEAIRDLMAQGLVYDENGKPLPTPAQSESTKRDLVETLGHRLESGQHLFIYQKDTQGKSQPREIYYDWKKGKLIVTELKDLEPVEPAQEEPQQVQQPQEQVNTNSVQAAPPDPKTKSEMILEKLQKAHGGEPLPDQVKQNVENICRNAQMGMEQLKHQLDSETMLQGGDNIRYILLQNSLEVQAENGKLEPTFMQALNEENGLEVLRRSADLSPVVKHMTTHKVDAKAFECFRDNDPRLYAYSAEYHQALTKVTARAEEQSGKSMEDLLKGIDPKKAEKIKADAAKSVKKDAPKKKKEAPQKEAPKKEAPKKEQSQPKAPQHGGGLGLH